MSANIEGKEMLKKKEIQESTNDDFSFSRLADQNESEIQWVQLHQMFDR
tara:strand:+ start:556 stop:702 length:147 start_codon:yes stop_codon:yes gene_type:complete